MTRCFMACLMILALTAGWAQGAPQEGKDNYQGLLEQHGQAVVSVKFMLKMSMGTQERQNESEVTGLVVDPEGLVLCSNTATGGFARLLTRGGNPVTITPTDIKVLIGDDQEGLEATLLARDSELDLAWVKIKDTKGKKLAFVDPAKNAPTQIGQTVLSLRRLSKYFDRTTAVGETRIGGHARKPRELMIPAEPQGIGLGLPIFNAKGEFLGFSILQMPEDGGGSNPRPEGGNFILPAAEVSKATKAARLTVPPETQPAKPAGAAPAAPDAGTKPTP